MTQEATETPRSLGICVTSRRGARHIPGLLRAAARAEVSAEVFLTGEGVLAVREPCFPEILASARVSLCDVSFRAAGLDAGDVPGLTDRDFATQWRNAEMVERCDRYLVL